MKMMNSIESRASYLSNRFRLFLTMYSARLCQQVILRSNILVPWELRRNYTSLLTLILTPDYNNNYPNDGNFAFVVSGTSIAKENLALWIFSSN